MHHRLRIYDGESSSPAVSEPNVNVRFGEILTALLHALRSNRAWLSDFEDDEIQVSNDLYQVISAYTHLRPGA